MISAVLVTALCVASMTIVSALLGALFRMHARRFDALVARDLLDDWELQLQLLAPGEREQARLAPSADVLAAMAILPLRRRAGLRSG